MNIFGTKLQQGRHYMTLWPRRPELNSMFPENRVIKATEFALKVIPALAVLSVAGRGCLLALPMDCSTRSPTMSAVTADKVQPRWPWPVL